MSAKKPWSKRFDRCQAFGCRGKRFPKYAVALATSEGAGPSTSSQEQEPSSVPVVHAPALLDNPTVDSVPLDCTIENESDRMSELETDEDFDDEQARSIFET